jgi:hypothetical protein
MPFVGGIRPGATDVYRMRPPGWMLEHGWALTAEVGGVTAREGLGPHIQPTVAWIRARDAGATLLIGGRNLGNAGDPAARITLATAAGILDAIEAPPGFFAHRLVLPAGTLAGAGYVPLRVSASAADGSGRAVRVALEQFDLQPDGVPMVAFESGWNEPEYNPTTAAAWRWSSERAVLWVRPVGREVVLTVRGESPLRYFDRPPDVRVTVGDREAGRFLPSADFSQEIRLPAAALAAADGRVELTSDLWFSPADRSGAADRRHLALRIYGVSVR